MPPPNLQSAFTKVWRNGGGAGADEQTVAHFAREAEAELARLHAQLRDGTINRNRFGGLGYPSLAARSGGRWGCRRGVHIAQGAAGFGD